MSATNLKSALIRFGKVAACSLAGHSGVILTPVLAIGADWIGKRIGADDESASALTKVLAGMLDQLGGDAVHQVISSLDSSTSRDLEVAVLAAIRGALSSAREHFSPQGRILVESFDTWFELWDARIQEGIANPATTLLFSSDKLLDPVDLASANETQWWPAFRPVLLRWASEQMAATKCTSVDPSVLPVPLDQYLAKDLLLLTHRALRVVLREEKHQRGWIAWQQDLLEAIAIQVRTSDSGLAYQLAELCRHTDELRPLLENRFSLLYSRLDDIGASVSRIESHMGDNSQTDRKTHHADRPDNIPSELLAPNFTGRLDDLELLHKEFFANSQPALRTARSQAISGLGGAGPKKILSIQVRKTFVGGKLFYDSDATGPVVH